MPRLAFTCRRGLKQIPLPVDDHTPHIFLAGYDQRNVFHWCREFFAFQTNQFVSSVLREWFKTNSLHQNVTLKVGKYSWVSRSTEKVGTIKPLRCEFPSILTCFCVEKDTGVVLDSDNDNEQPTWRSFTLNVLSNKLTFTAFAKSMTSMNLK